MQLTEKIEKNTILPINFELMIQSIDGMISIHDDRHRFVAVSQTVAMLCGFNKSEEMIGLRNHEIKVGAAIQGAEYDQQNRDVIISKSSRKYFGINGPYSSGDCNIILYEKMNMNFQNREFVFTYARDVTDENFVYQLTKLIKLDQGYLNKTKHNYAIDNFESLFRLTDREKEILFYTLRGKSAKESANILKISTKTAEFHLMNLKQKFDVPNRSNLIDKAIELGYLYCIPSSCLKHNRSL